MSILKHSRTHMTGERYPDQIPSTSISREVVESAAIAQPEFPFRRGYRIEVTFAQEFQCTDAEKLRATEAAYAVVCQNVYADILRHLPQLRLCVIGGDRRGAMALIDAIEEETKP